MTAAAWAFQIPMQGMADLDARGAGARLDKIDLIASVVTPCIAILFAIRKLFRLETPDKGL
jgi:hypothetical protein